MWETCTPAVLTLMTRVAAISRADLAVGVATGDEGQDLRLPRRQAEELPQALRSVGRPSVRRRELQPRALGEQLELPGQGRCSDPGRDGVRLPERPTCLGAGGAGGDQRLSLAPAAGGREGRALELLPGRCGLPPPRLGLGGAAGALVLGLGQGAPAGDVPCDGCGLRGGAASEGDEPAAGLAADGRTMPRGGNGGSWAS